MQKMFFTLMMAIMAIMLAGCGRTVDVVIDNSTINELPKNIAIAYLSEISKRHPNYRWTRMDCVFHEGYVTNRKYELSKTNKKTYKQINFTANVYEPEAILSLYLDRFCVIGDVMGFKNHSDPEINVIANKISTALKSLVVQVKTKQ